MSANNQNRFNTNSNTTKKSWGGPPEIKPSEIKRGKALGDGSFGTVFQGKAREKDVAVKVLHKQDLDPKTLAAFKKEVEIMSKIYHPNIVLFMGACTTPGSMAIITELMPKGDLEALLQDPNVKLSLLKRTKMGRDAALGMTWLHLANPVIMHRDLKASNLLVDNNWNVKICDFGLSQVKARGETLRDGADGAKGTPLWMAPEVMSGEKFNEKADVYSFGIVLWEILTQEEPFLEFDNFEDFRNAVCIKHTRPIIPDNSPSGLKTLISQCWHPLPQKRPSFPEIVNALDRVIVDIAIRDPHGRVMWKEFFLKESQAPWSKFRLAFEKTLGKYMPKAWPKDQKLPDSPTDYQLQNASEKQLDEFAKRSQQAFYRATQEFSRRSSDSSSSSSQNSSNNAVLDDLNVQIFQLLLCDTSVSKGVVSDSSESQVDAERFGKILEWFGPIVDEKNSCSTFLDRVKTVCSKQWFHGDLPTKQAESALHSRPVGTFLIRFSSTALGCYTISKVSRNRSISHQRVLHQRGGGFRVNNKRYSSLEQLVADGKKDLGLLRSCGGSKIYTTLFQQNTISGYIQMDDE